MNKILFIVLVLGLLPFIGHAQLQTAWNVMQHTNTPPPSAVSLGSKLSYRTVNNSLYMWDGTQWKRIAGPGIVDTSYSLSFSSPTLSLLGSGSSVSLTNLYTASYGLTKTGETWKADSALLATKLYTNRFLLKSDTLSMLAAYIRSAGYGLLKTSYTLSADTTLLGTRAYARTLLAIPSTRIVVGTGTGVTGYSNFVWDNTNNYLGINQASPSARLHLSGNQSATSWTTNGIGFRVDNATYTNTTSSGALAFQAAHRFGIPTFASTSSTQITDAVNIYVAGVPVPGTNTTIVNTGGRAWALYVDGLGLNGNGYNTFINGSIWASRDAAFGSAYYAIMGFPGATQYILRLMSGLSSGTNIGLATKTSPINGTTQTIGFEANGAGLYASQNGLDASWSNGSPFNIAMSRVNFMGGGATTTISRLIGATGFLGLNTGTSDPSYILDINSTNAIRIPRGTDAQRPTSAAGLFRYSTTGSGYEGNDGSGYYYLLQSSLTGGKGTATRIPFFDANGRATDDPGLTYTAATGLNVTSTSMSHPYGGLTLGGTATTATGVNSFLAALNISTTLNSSVANNTRTGIYVNPTFTGTAASYAGIYIASKTQYSAVGTAALVIPTSTSNGIYISGTSNVALIQLNPTNSTTKSIVVTNSADNNYAGIVVTRTSSSIGVGTGMRFNVSQGGVSDAQSNMEIGAVLAETGTKFRDDMVFRATYSDGVLFTNERARLTSYGLFGVGTAVPSEMIHSADDIRVGDSLRIGTPLSSILRTDASGWVSPVTIGTGLSFSGGTLSNTVTAFSDTLKRWSNVLFVSPNGDNATAVKNKLTKPWLTPQAARDASTSGDLIVVLTGSYANPTNLWKPGVDWHFENVTINNNITTEYIVNSAIFKATSSGTMRITGNLTTGQLLQVDTADVNVYAEGHQLGQIWIGPGAVRANIHAEAKIGNSQVYVAATAADSIIDNHIYYHTKFVSISNAVGIRHNNNSTIPARNSITWEADVVDYGNTTIFFTNRGFLANQSTSASYNHSKLNIIIHRGNFNSSSNEQLIGFCGYANTPAGNELSVHCDDCEFRGNSTLSSELRAGNAETVRITGRYTTYSKVWPLFKDIDITSNKVIFKGDFTARDTTLFILGNTANWQFEGNFRTFESDDYVISGSFANGGNKPLLRNFHVISTATTPIQSSTATTWYTAGAFDYGTITLDPDITFTKENEYSPIKTTQGSSATIEVFGKYQLPNKTIDSHTRSQVLGQFNGSAELVFPVRDTFVQDVTLFSVGTLLYTCDHLVVNTSMTGTAPSNMEIRFPDAADIYRGKKITVYSGRKDAGVYVPEIKMVGGVSRLRYTTDSSTSGSMPTDNSVLTLDGSTWSYNGVSYEWTCVKIDASNYRWILKQ